MYNNLKNNIGKIYVNDELKGTCFLISGKILITATHCIDNVQKEDISIDFYDNNQVTKKITVIDITDICDLDISLLELEYNIENYINYPIHVSNSNSNINDFDTYSIGYMQNISKSVETHGTIKAINYDDSMGDTFGFNVLVGNFYGEYAGYSGAPLLISGYIVGVIVKEDISNNTLHAISFNQIQKDLLDRGIEFYEQKLIKICNNYNNILEKSKTYKVHQEKIIGPRYSRDLNVANDTDKNLMQFSDANIIKNRISIALQLVDDYKESLTKIEDNDFDIASMQIPLDNIKEDISNILVDNDFDIKKYLRLLESKILSLKNSDQRRDVLSSYNKEYLEQTNLIGKYSITLMDLNQTLYDEANELNILLDFYKAKSILLKGIGGIGKTHSLFQICSTQVENDIPSFFFTGEQFKNDIETTIQSELGNEYVPSLDELLHIINTVAIQRNSFAIICIDAINETHSFNWDYELKDLLVKIDKYTNLKLLVSCRTLFLDNALDDEVVNEFSKRLVHEGSVYNDHNLIQKYFKHYNINDNVQTSLSINFETPLMLKTFCEIYGGKNDELVNIDDHITLPELFGKFKKDKINRFKQIVVRNHNKLNNIINNIIDNMVDSGRKDIDDNDLVNIIQELYKNENFDNIINFLISENILKETGSETFSFAYDTMFDCFYAQNISDNSQDKTIFLIKTKDIFYSTKFIAVNLILFALFKDKFKEEIYHYMQDIIDGDYTMQELFNRKYITSLVWQKNKNIDLDTQKVVAGIFKNNNDYYDEIITTLFKLALRKNISLNARFLHDFFLCHKSTVRTNLILDNYLLYNGNIALKIINGALNIKTSSLDIEVMRLWCITLSWFTSSINAEIRDRASKGLVNVFKLYPEIMLGIVELFDDIDDDYIHIRIWGAIYVGIYHNKISSIDILNKITELIKTKEVDNIVIRDYMMKIAEYCYDNNIIKKDELIQYPHYKIVDTNYDESHDTKEIFLNRFSIDGNKDISLEEYNLNKDLFNSSCLSVSDEIQNNINYEDLYTHCTNSLSSDFYTYVVKSFIQVPDDCFGTSLCQPYSTKEIANLLFNKIYNFIEQDDNIIEDVVILDNRINENYGLSRSRDEKMERLTKKYEKIFLARIVGKLSQRYYVFTKGYDDVHHIECLSRDGYDLEKIDLFFSLEQKQVEDMKLETLYTNYKYKTADEWIEEHDVGQFVEDNILPKNTSKNVRLHTSFSLSKIIDKGNIWFIQNTYLVKNEHLGLLKNYFEHMRQIERNIPEMSEHINLDVHEVSKYMLSHDEFSEGCDINTRDNINNMLVIKLGSEILNEQDSTYCNNTERYICVPNPIFNANLKFDGYNSFVNKDDKGIFKSLLHNNNFSVNKEFLDNFLKENNYSLIFHILGEKRIIGKDRDTSKGYRYLGTFFYKNSTITKIKDYNIELFPNKKEDK